MLRNVWWVICHQKISQDITRAGSAITITISIFLYLIFNSDTIFCILTFHSAINWQSLPFFSHLFQYVTYLLSEVFSQYLLEAYFSCQRQKGESSDNPTVQQFHYNTASLFQVIIHWYMALLSLSVPLLFSDFSRDFLQLNHSTFLQKNACVCFSKPTISSFSIASGWLNSCHKLTIYWLHYALL